jgi:hypothetical protein
MYYALQSIIHGSVAKNILATFHSSGKPTCAITSCMVSEFLQQILGHYTRDAIAELEGKYGKKNTPKRDRMR